MITFDKSPYVEEEEDCRNKKPFSYKHVQLIQSDPSGASLGLNTSNTSYLLESGRVPSSLVLQDTSKS